MQPNVESMIEAAKRLPPADRRRLAEALLERYPPEQSEAHHITEIRGVGKDLWIGLDAQTYVNAERDAWEN